MRALGYFLCETAKRRQMKALIMGCNFLLVLGFMPFRVWIGKRFPQITISKSNQKAPSSQSFAEKILSKDSINGIFYFYL